MQNLGTNIEPDDSDDEKVSGPPVPVSYTHLDVYKRQAPYSARNLTSIGFYSANLYESLLLFPSSNHRSTEPKL